MDAVRQSEAARRFEPTEHYADWREHCPLHHDAEHDPPFYALSRFDDIVEVLKQHDHWVNRHGPGVFHQEDGVLGTTDEPDHGRHRRVLRAAFVPTVINRLEPSIRSITTELIDAVVADGRCDFVEAIAEPLPALAIAELLGIAPDDRHDFRRLSSTVVAALTGDDIAAYRAAKQEIEDYVEAGVRERSRSIPDGEATDDLLGGAIPDDVMGRLAIARHNGTIDDREMRHLGYQLLVAGHETTTSLLGLMMLRLIELPAVIDALRADPGLIPVAVEEALRFDSPVHGLFRTNVEECELHGQTLAPGTKLQLVYAAANRDPGRFADPDEFRLDRDRAELGRHVAFGWGIHFCIGAPLARLETRVVVEEVLRRMTDIQLAGTPERNDSFVLHGLTHLPIVFRPASGGHT